MPTTYAHFIFGWKAYNYLPKELQRLIDSKKTLFQTGLHGPDILFYYRPLKGNPLVELAHNIHERSAIDFFENARSEMGKCPDKEGALVYLVGFFFHYILDRDFHPIVSSIVGNDSAQHNRLEKELDRKLMIRENLDPLSYRPGVHLGLSPGDAEIISFFYPGVSTLQIEKSVRDMKRLLAILVTPGKWKYRLLRLIFFLSGRQKKFGSLLMPMSPDTRYAESSERMADLLDRSVRPAAALANDLYMSLSMNEGEGPLSKELLMQMKRNFV